MGPECWQTYPDHSGPITAELAHRAGGPAHLGSRPPAPDSPECTVISKLGADLNSPENHRAQQVQTHANAITIGKDVAVVFETTPKDTEFQGSMETLIDTPPHCRQIWTITRVWMLHRQLDMNNQIVF
jgi:hypothetical protein